MTNSSQKRRRLMARQFAVKVSFNERELELLDKDVQKAGSNRAQYLRSIWFATKIKRRKYNHEEF
jgi:hypothetical protein